MTMILASIVLKIASYSFGFTGCIWWAVKDLRNRKLAQHTNESNAVPTSNEKEIYVKPFHKVIAPTLHYVSMLLYIVCTLNSLFGLLASIPYLCEYTQNNIRVFLFGFSKLVIMLFQIERLVLCFGKTSNRHKYFFIGLKIFIFLCTLWGLYYAFFETFTVVFLPFHYCETHYNQIHTIVIVSSIIAMDWTVLFIYVFQIQLIKHRWKQLNMDMSSTSANNDNDNDNNNISGRLNFILKKILFLSLIMEIPFSIVSTLALFFSKNDNIIALIILHCVYNIDSATNIVLVSYMLEYNKSRFDIFSTRYNNFIRMFKCECTDGLIFEENAITVTESAQQPNKDVIKATTETKQTQNDNMQRKLSAETTYNNDESKIEIQSANHSNISKDETHNFGVL